LTVDVRPIAKPGKKRKRVVDDGYRYIYRELNCIVPGCEHPTMYCHWPTHRGMGGRNAGWGFDEGIPGCQRHHDILDARDGTWAEHETMQALVAALAPAFWERMRA
jgi:hypothetical protein